MKFGFFVKNAGFTLAEVMVALGCFSIVGGIAFALINSGTILYAKNYSINSAHEDTRKGINRLLRDIHASVSVPQLIDGFNLDESVQSHSNNNTGAAGVAFQLVANGPDYVWQDPTAANLIMIYDGGSQPTPGQRLIIPLWGLEADVTRAVLAGNSGHSNIFLQDTSGAVVQLDTSRIKSPPSFVTQGNRNKDTVYAITYYTDRVAYIVQNGQLRLYYRRYLGGSNNGTGGTWKWVNPSDNDPNGVTVARNITSPAPFSLAWNSTSGVASIAVTSSGSGYSQATTVSIIGGGGSGATATASISGGKLIGVTVTNPGSGYYAVPTVAFSSDKGGAAVASLNGSPTPDDRYVHVVLTASDPTYSNRQFKAITSMVDCSMPYRSRLCSYQ